MRFMCHCFGHHGDALSLSHDFYKSPITFNENHVTLVLAEGVNDDGFGVAIMNRMEKASSHHIIISKFTSIKSSTDNRNMSLHYWMNLL